MPLTPQKLNCTDQFLLKFKNFEVTPDKKKKQGTESKFTRVRLKQIRYVVDALEQ